MAQTQVIYAEYSRPAACAGLAESSIPSSFVIDSLEHDTVNP